MASELAACRLCRGCRQSELECYSLGRHMGEVCLPGVFCMQKYRIVDTSDYDDIMAIIKEK